MKKYYLILACAALAVCCCTKPDDQPEKPVVEDVFNVAPASIDVACDAVCAKIDVTSNIDWTASAGEGVTLSLESGNGDAEIAVSFAANDSFDAKVYTVSVTAAKADFKGQKEYTVQINQAGVARSISVSTPQAVAWDVLTAVVSVNANIAWKASVSGGASIDIAEGEGSADIKVIFPYNITESAKSYIVTVTPDDENWTGEEKFEASVVQNAASPALEFGTDTMSFSDLIGGSSNVNVSTAPYTSAAGIFTLTFDKGTNSNVPKYYWETAHVRVYGGNTTTIASEKLISSIEFTSTDGYELSKSSSSTVDSGSINNNTWTGAARTVVFSKSSNSDQFRPKTIKVTYVK